MAAFELTVRTGVRGYHDYKEVKLGTHIRQQIVYHQERNRVTESKMAERGATTLSDQVSTSQEATKTTKALYVQRYF